jgi:rhamnogalacturonyl hydrolase YesR
MYNLTGGEEIYKTAAQTLRDQIDRSFRTPDGGFYHRFPGYIDQVCLNGYTRTVCCLPRSMRASKGQWPQNNA